MIEIIVSFLLGSLAMTLAYPTREIKFKQVSIILAGLMGLLIFLPGTEEEFQKLESNLLFVGFIILTVILMYLMNERHKYVSYFLAGIILLTPVLSSISLKEKVLFQDRNYYGIYKVFERKGFRYFQHGATLHGTQYLDPNKKNQPLTYYYPESPIGEILGSNRFNFSNFALVGLGIGALANYKKPQDRYDFYELDPLVGSIAQKYFDFGEGNQKGTNLIFGDARLSLRKAEKDQYDVLVIDVFSSGSIPVHLVTQEAIAEYFTVLKKKKHHPFSCFQPVRGYGTGPLCCSRQTKSFLFSKNFYGS